MLDIKSKFYNIVLHTTALKGLSRSEKKKKAIKLHQQFAHCSKERLIKLVKESKNFDDKEFLEILEECYDNCEFCQQIKKAPLRPVVGISLADKFNQVVCMDLKGIVYGKIAKKFYFLFEVLSLYRIKICIKIYMVSLGITP